MSSSSFAHLLDDIHQHDADARTQFEKHLSIISSKPSEISNEDEILPLMVKEDVKQQGNVGWHVYTSYIRAGLGSIFGFGIVLLFFTLQQTAYMYSSWWLAIWSDDESYRHGHIPNCTSMTTEKVNHIRSMNSTEWDHHRNRKFYTYCSELWTNQQIS
jgi:hypothetical protein